MGKLTLKQKKFADEYLISGNATEAAVNAGYSEKYAGANADKLLKNTKIKAYIDARLAELESQKIASQEEVLQYLTSVMRGESSSAVLVVEGTGEGTSAAKLVYKPPDERERTKAAELLGKRYGTWTERVDLQGELAVTFVDDVPVDDDG